MDIISITLDIAEKFTYGPGVIYLGDLSKIKYR